MSLKPCLRIVLSGLALLVLLPIPSQAQAPDFWFGAPHGTVAVRTGWMQAGARSDIFTFVQNQLTLQRRDFNAPAVGFDLDLAMTPRASAVAGFDFSRSSRQSEYRNLVDNNRLPINQTTNLRQFNLSASVKFALAPRGREVSPHAWIPSAVTPFVGAGGGLMRYTFTQVGDFVDFVDASVFTDTYSSSAWGPSAHVFGGVDVKAWRHLYLSGEARYLWSHAHLGGDFSGFAPIDLSGFKMTGGIRYMF
jgi:hypothetical protein